MSTADGARHINLAALLLRAHRAAGLRCDGDEAVFRMWLDLVWLWTEVNE